MAEWLKTALIDIVELIGGGTPKTSKAEYWGGNINWLSVKDFNNENRYVYSTEKTITEEGLNNSSTKLLKKDDIIISARGTVGELAMIPFPMAFNQSCYGIRAKEGIDSIFLYYLIKNSVRKLKAITHLGITRLIPTLAESDAIKHGTLTNDEKNRYRAIFYNRTATVTMINEAKSVKDNARIVAQNGVPQVPMLFFISDGTGGTGFDKETWRRIQEKYISEVESGKYIELDCPHYVHDYEYERISEEIKSFLRIRLMTVL